MPVELSKKGRGWAVVGAHPSGFNSVGYGVCFIGSYEDDFPEDSMIAGYEEFQSVSERASERSDTAKSPRMKELFSVRSV